jgi:hypothetical protein
MRFVFAVTAIAAVLLSTAAAQAEKRVFIIANDSDAYGVDHCLSTGGPCGSTVANAYCHSHDYASALSFRKVDRDDITGAIPTGSGATCKGGNCDNFVAIECTR